LLVAAPFGPRFDNRHGGRVIAQLLGRLAERHDVAVVYLRMPGSPPIDSGLAARCELVEEVEMEMNHSWPGQEWRHRLHVLSTPLTGLPSPVAALFSRRFAKIVREVALHWKPDVIQIEHDALGYCAALIEGLAPATVLVCHDPGVGASADLAQITRGRQRLAHRLDAITWRRYWSRTLPRLDATVAFTNADARVLRSVIPDLNVVRIPIGIELPAEPFSATGSGDGKVLFVGGYSHPPNADAALRLITSIMPIARRRLPGSRLMLVGDRPTDHMRAIASAQDAITGAVPQVGPYVDEAALVVLPIRIGGGMRVKLLEALAAGKAVVASPLAAAGLDVTDGRELVLADTDQEFADAIVTLLGDDAARVGIGRKAREWALRNLSAESRASEYEQLYRELLSARRG
jgi:glycosyltransferase involved in cell wall biosynthesis